MPEFWLLRQNEQETQYLYEWKRALLGLTYPGDVLACTAESESQCPPTTRSIGCIAALMKDSSNERNYRPSVLQTITEVAQKAFDPSADPQTKELEVRKYNDLISQTDTWQLLSALNALIKPAVLPSWLRQPLLESLTLLPLRHDGIRATMEFIFSVHPSNRNATESRKDGAAITHEATAALSKLLSSVPSTMTADAWFDGISSQLFDLIDEKAGADLAKTASQVVGFGILGKKQFGAPGAPGWQVFIQPLLERVNPSLTPEQGELFETDVINLRQDQVLVSSTSLSIALQRLNSLLLSNTSPGLCRRVLRPIIPQLWALCSWIDPCESSKDEICRTAKNLLQAYYRLFGDAENIDLLLQYILCQGSTALSRPWRYDKDAEGGICIRRRLTRVSMAAEEPSLVNISDKASSLVNFLQETSSSREISAVFLNLLRRWLSASKAYSTELRMVPDHENENSQSPTRVLVELSLVQNFLEKVPEKLISQYDQLIDIICQVLVADGRSPVESELLSIVLSLLNLVVTATNFEKPAHLVPKLREIEGSLQRIRASQRGDLSVTAMNLSTLLTYRGAVEPQSMDKTAAGAGLADDRKSYDLAMHYITGDSENPPPIIAEGLNILSKLIADSSPILDVTTIQMLMAGLLKEKEDFITMKVVKVFTLLADKHPKSTVQELLDGYLDRQERLSTDDRLRHGEALLQVIERLGQTFTGDIAQQVGETLLSIAGRRGHRPQAAARQARDEKARGKLELQGEGEDETAEAHEEMTEDVDSTEPSGARNHILREIVRGWDSQRGSEDMRMRTSALSLFGAGLETNLSGVGPTLVSNAVDLCINVVCMERGLAACILRRAAVLVVLAFVRALDRAREEKRSLGFGLTDASRNDIQGTLAYVAETDADGLVQQHARDVVDCLQAWQMSRLVAPPADEPGASGIVGLAGLRLKPTRGLVDDREHPQRAGIEEVE